VRISTTSVTYRSSLYFVLALATQSSLGNRRLRRDPSGARPRTLDIVALALATRLLVLWFVVERFPHRWLYSRGIELGTLAQSLLAGQGLSSPFGGSTGPTALLAPGYPAVIALIFRIFGSFTFAAAIAVMAMQVLFSVGTVLLIMHVAQRCFDSRTADLAGVFWAVSLPLLWMPTIFWETCLSTLLLVGMIALALRCEQKPSRSLWALMGGYCGLAALVNPALLMALLALLGWAAWQTRQTLPYSPLLGLLVLLLVFAPWPIRNARALGGFIPLRSTVGFELWMGNRAGATGFLDESVFPLFNRWEYDQYAAKGEVAYMRDKSALAKSYIRAHPVEFLRLSSIRFVRFWTGTGSKGGSILFAIHALLTSCLGAMGMWRLWQRRRFGVAALFLLPLMIFPLPYYITHAEFRYRLVVDPLLTILAAYSFGAEKV
jgi:4-amino-4-deoxy-L-arabinose transferase-like glycosyltransferase